ncbi:MAG: hypothetical protein CMP49_04855 [Flavobacteriales bacterium]|nr:hypothetical protein [Flavobacteriales bacterium]|tara:strand:- start:266 stop:922 length:657 start_codon:yes stop_codon:yes gene_type:complete
MIKENINTEFKPCKLDDLAINTLAIMEEYKISEIPVVNDNNQFLGILKESIILDMENINESLHFIKKYLKNIFLFSNAHIFQGIQIFNSYALSLIPIIDDNHKYIGYIKPCDILNQMNLNNYNTQHINFITITLKNKDYSLTEISRLIEENNGKIISIITERKENKLNLNLLIFCINVTPIKQTLKRYNYDFQEFISTNLKTTNLDDRFESFIKYLNI